VLYTLYVFTFTCIAKMAFVMSCDIWHDFAGKGVLSVPGGVLQSIFCRFIAITLSP